MKKMLIEISDEFYNRVAGAPRCASFSSDIADRNEMVKAIQNGTVISEANQVHPTELYKLKNTNGGDDFVVALVRKFTDGEETYAEVAPVEFSSFIRTVKLSALEAIDTLYVEK